MSAFWSDYSADPKERKKLQLALMVPPFVLLLLVPMGIAAATQKRRELHGSARFASAIEVRDAGLLGDTGNHRRQVPRIGSSRCPASSR